MTSELFQVGSVSVPETTYFLVSLKNGAPGSSSTVRVDQAGSNISYVWRPSRIAFERVRDLRERRRHLRQELVVERPHRRVGDAVKSHELVHVNFGHATQD